MSNTELTKYYLAMQPNTQIMPETAYFDIIEALQRHFNGQWTWELADEKLIMDGTTVSTTVTLYIPGKVCTGRSLCKIKDYHNNHLFALLDACQTFMEKKTNSFMKGQPQNNESDPNHNRMTADEIMKAMGNPPQEQVNTAVQFYNYKDNNGMPADVVPFDSMTDNCNQELNQENGINTPQNNAQSQPSMPPQQNNPQMNMNNNQNVDYNAPQARLKGFSQRQVDGINKFKKDYEITNDAMFDSWVNTWKPELTSKKDIIPDNVDEFLKFIDDMGKKGC